MVALSQGGLRRYGCFGGPWKKKLSLHSVCDTGWTMRKHRNNKIFRGVEVDAEKFVRDIKSSQCGIGARVGSGGRNINLWSCFITGMGC
ncbi:hypothetical protein FRX31_007801 [Thalictrum thalictroides]|uniref:Uncharacterized protein n=1 Tax=Thalictrum thalictroides TaxID=46969 RepID=A0A7J6WYT9_THATH|nr:hypothetical protein FRX31_007801 [Thalictrum thalictroides]